MILDGDELAPTRSATTVRVRDGQTVVTDGPYAETKEALGGYYLVECASIDEARRLGRADPRRAARRDRGAAGARERGRLGRAQASEREGVAS